MLQILPPETLIHEASDTRKQEGINYNIDFRIIDHCNRHIVTHSQVKRTGGSLNSRFAFTSQLTVKAQFVLAGQHGALTITVWLSG